MKHVYLMPGMAASPLIFEHIKLPEDEFTMHHMEWLMPEKKESLTTYCVRLLEQVKHERPVLIGVSFGGIIVQEMARLMEVDKLIIISSVKSIKEFPKRVLFTRSLGLLKILPTSLIGNFEGLSKYVKRIAPKKIALYKRYLGVDKSEYLDWALDAMVNWDQKNAPKNIIHIHGDQDHIFPIKYIEKCLIIKGGTHVMIINRYRWFNENLPKIIATN